MEPLTLPHRFRVWSYGVGHSQLVLHAHANDDDEHVNVLFEDVRAVKLRTSYHPLTLRAADHDTRASILTFAEIPERHQHRYLSLALPTPASGFVLCARATVLATPAPENAYTWNEHSRVLHVLRQPRPSWSRPVIPMMLTVGMVDRPEPPLIAGEREMLRGFLEFHRATLAMKCEGLSDEDLREQSMPPSTLSLLGLVRHMAEVERTWFRRVINSEDVPLVWSDEGDFQVAYDASSATRSEAFAAWEAEVEHSRRIEREAESLDVTGFNQRWDEHVSLRLVMMHMMHEYARHNGHADFLREGIDGVTGA